MAGQSLESFTRLSLIWRMDASVYRLTMFSFALALAHFATEVLVFKTATFNAPGTLSPLIVACEFLKTASYVACLICSLYHSFQSYLNVSHVLHIRSIEKGKASIQ